ncbi:hypothetical protein TKK_0000438 [Trichogramma kaykai]|uniref:Uncharacterized protein n=1 Tax=Trichogramma kaykai TaxID=54128 RepID=A0ABD2VY64_9HYME
MSADDKNSLLDSSILTNDESGELDPAVLAQFKAYEKAIAALTSQVNNLTQRLDNQNSTEQSGLPNGPTVSTAADTNTSTLVNHLQCLFNSHHTVSHTEHLLFVH